MRTRLTNDGLTALVGKTLGSVVHLSGVPKGTRGTVVTAEQSGGGDAIPFVMDRELQGSTRNNTVRDSFTPCHAKMRRFLREVC